MGRPLTCDLCLNDMFTEFSEPAYELKVWRKTHSYDGYNPWVRKQKLDVCVNCMTGIIEMLDAEGALSSDTPPGEHSVSRKLAQKPTKKK